MLVTEVLEDLGYAAIEAADGASGLKVLQSDVRIDMLITDVGLPGGMNGRQMADAGRQHRADLKVLFITGYAENAALNHGHLGPGMQVMTKPSPWRRWPPTSAASSRARAEIGGRGRGARRPHPGRCGRAGPGGARRNVGAPPDTGCGGARAERAGGVRRHCHTDPTRP